MIELTNITAAAGGKEILKDLNAVFEDNITYCIMGPSGIGKTTLLKIISGILKPDKGEIKGLDGKKKSFVFQENRLIEWLNVFDNIKYVTDNEQSIESALKDTGLWEDRKKLPPELSGGMARRAAIARAAAFGGDIFFIDEPLYGLDIKTGEDILSFIKKTVKGKTSFIITHSPEGAFFLADKIIFLNKSPVSFLDSKDISYFVSENHIKDYLLQNFVL